MRYSHDQRMARAAELTAVYPASRDILEFYREVVRFQKGIFDEICARGETDVESLAAYFPDLRTLLERVAPETLAPAAARLADPAAQRRLLVDCWEGSLPEDWFFGRALVAPFAEALAARGSVDAQWAGSHCPFCGALPALAILRGEGDGGKRSLQCSLCSTEWQFRRLLCPACGEENKEKLPVYIAEEFEHVRVEACDSCQSYIKSIDLTKNGRAVPAVDEIATVALNIWAEEHGYSKIAPNAVGM